MYKGSLVQVFDQATRSEVGRYGAPSETVCALSVKDREHIIVVGLARGELLVLNTNGIGELIHQIQHPTTATVRHVFQVGPNLVATVQDGVNNINVWDINTSRLSHTVPGYVIDWNRKVSYHSGALYDIATANVLCRLPAANARMIDNPNRIVCWNEHRTYLCEFATGVPILSVPGTFHSQLRIIDAKPVPRPTYVCLTVAKFGPIGVTTPQLLIDLLKDRRVYEELEQPMNNVSQEVQWFESRKRVKNSFTDFMTLLVISVVLLVLIVGLVTFGLCMKDVIWDEIIYKIGRRLAEKKGDEILLPCELSLTKAGVKLRVSHDEVPAGHASICGLLQRHQVSTVMLYKATIAEKWVL